MKTSDAGLAFIAREEGEVLHVYIDAVGVPTIGVGHALKPGESFAGGITHDQAIELLRKDIAIAESPVNDSVKVPLTQGQFDALVSFTFNCGGGAFKSSAMLRYINEGNLQAAADELPKYCHGGGKVLPGLLARRNRERAMFLKDVVPPAPVVAETPIAVVPGLPGESAADKIVRLVKNHVGCSLSERRDELGKLVARGVDKPEEVVTIATNCGTTALGIMAEAGVKHPLLNKPYVSGMAIGWLRQIAQDQGALVKFDGKTMPKPGSLLRYNTAGTNNDHVEWLLGPIDSKGIADHAGGGRANNAISEGTGDVRTSWSRPLVEWVDPDKLQIDLHVVQPEPAPEPVPAPEPQPEPQPDPKPGPIVPVPAVTPAWKTIWNFIMMLINLFLKRGQ